MKRVVVIIVLLGLILAVIPLGAVVAWEDNRPSGVNGPAPPPPVGGPPGNWTGPLSYSFNYFDFQVDQFGMVVKDEQRMYTFSRPSNAAYGNPMNPVRWELHGYPNICDHYLISVYAEDKQNPNKRIPIVSLNDEVGDEYHDCNGLNDANYGYGRHDIWRGWTNGKGAKKGSDGVWRGGAILNPASGHCDRPEAYAPYAPYPASACVDGDRWYLDPWGVPLNHFPGSPQMWGRVDYSEINDWLVKGDPLIPQVQPEAIISYGTWAPLGPYSLILRLDNVLNDWARTTNDERVKAAATKLGIPQSEMWWCWQDTYNIHYKIYAIDKVGKKTNSWFGAGSATGQPQALVEPTYNMTVGGPRKWITKKESEKAAYTFKIKLSNPGETAGQPPKITKIVWDVMGEKKTNTKTSQTVEKMWLEPTKKGHPDRIWANATIYWEVRKKDKYEPFLVVIGDEVDTNYTPPEMEVVISGESKVSAFVDVNVFDTELSDW